MTTPFTLGVFQRLCPTGLGTPYWRHPDNQSTRYLELDYWIELAKKLEAAHFDYLFFADGYGVPLQQGQVPAPVLREAIQVPTADPFTVIPAIASHTERIGLVVTSSTMFEPPYASARRFASLDHFTKGRIGWNVVTSASAKSAADMFGAAMTPHDQRYDVAEDYMELSYRFFEGSWEPDAVLVDKEKHIYADPEKVHAIDYHGPHFSSRGLFGVEPSPQRVPVLFQAGSSERGRQFAGKHAEVVFLQGTTVPKVHDNVMDIRDKAEEAGRSRDSVRIVVGLTIFVAPTEAQAQAKYDEFRAMYTDEVAAASYAYNTGIDLLTLDPDKTLPQDISSEQGRSNVERYKDGVTTVREILDEFKGRGLRGLVLTGTPEHIADEMESYARQTGVDGYLIEPYVVPSVYDDIIELLLPVLRERGLAPQPHASNTLRERFFERDSVLPDEHPGAVHRVGR